MTKCMELCMKVGCRIPKNTQKDLPLSVKCQILAIPAAQDLEVPNIAKQAAEKQPLNPQNYIFVLM